jgi:beta-lactamase regulating signal transducer with metallopeptidase domain
MRLSPECAAMALIDLAVRASLILPAAWLLAALLRRRQAELRHAVWLMALGAVAVLPILTAVCPTWEAPVQVGAVRAPVVTEAATAPALATAMPTAALPDAAPVAHPSVAVPPPTRPAAPVAPLWPSILLSIWACGVAAHLGRSAAAGLRAHRLMRASKPADGRLASVAERAATDMGVSMPEVRVMPPGSRFGPMAMGRRRACVLLPSDADDWPEDRLLSVLLHEMAHVRRRDAAWSAAAGVVCALHWPNPLVWLAAARLRTEAERACDDRVLGAGIGCASYADHLLAVARTCRSGALQGSASAAARPPAIEDRVRALLEPRLNRRPLGAWSWVAALSAIALVTSVVASARVGAQAQTGAKAPAPRAHAGGAPVAAHPKPGPAGRPTPKPVPVRTAPTTARAEAEIAALKARIATLEAALKTRIPANVRAQKLQARRDALVTELAGLRATKDEPSQAGAGAEAELVQVDALLSQALASGPGASAREQNLRIQADALMAELARLGAAYRPAHPAMVERTARLQALNQLLDAAAHARPAKATAPPGPAPLAARAGDLTGIPLRHADASLVVRALRDQKPRPPGLTVLAADVAGNRVLVSGSERAVAEAREIVGLMDVEPRRVRLDMAIQRMAPGSEPELVSNPRALTFNNSEAAVSMTGASRTTEVRVTPTIHGDGSVTLRMSLDIGVGRTVTRVTAAKRIRQGEAARLWLPDKRDGMAAPDGPESGAGYLLLVTPTVVK